MVVLIRAISDLIILPRLVSEVLSELIFGVFSWYNYLVNKSSFMTLYNLSIQKVRLI